MTQTGVHGQQPTVPGLALHFPPKRRGGGDQHGVLTRMSRKCGRRSATVMSMTSPPGQPNDIAEQLRLAQFPRSAAYDAGWMLENVMGPNALWLLEALTEVLPLSPGMRVLDLGCGKALTSIFLAKEFGVRVWAGDLWIHPSENWKRIREAGVEADVIPLRLEAHALPFAAEFFDAIISIDAYHYFGTDDLYLSYLLHFLAPGGRIGLVSPGLLAEIDDAPPPELQPYWEPDFFTFHSAAWWQRHWERSGLVDVEVADRVPDGWQLWLRWSQACLQAKAAPTQEGLEAAAREFEMLRVDDGRTLGFSRLVARKR